MKKGILLFIVFILLLSAKLINAQVAEVKISFDKDTVFIGDYLNMKISASYKGGYVLFPSYKDSFSGFEIIESNPPFENDTNGLKEKSQVLTLIQFNPGMYHFAPAPFIFKNGDRIDTIFSNTFSVFVNTIVLDTTDIIKPLKGPIKIPYTLKELIPYIVGLLIFLVVLLFFIYWLSQRKKKANPIVKILTKLEAHEQALRRLKELDAAKKWQKGDVKNYYLALSETVREYIENRFKILAMESTTQEIISELEGLKIVNKSQTKHLKELLELSDLAKFAKMLPLPDENIKAMKLSLDFVAHTKPEKELNTEKKTKES